MALAQPPAPNEAEASALWIVRIQVQLVAASDVCRSAHFGNDGDVRHVQDVLASHHWVRKNPSCRHVDLKCSSRARSFYEARLEDKRSDGDDGMPAHRAVSLVVEEEHIQIASPQEVATASGRIRDQSQS